MGRGCYISLASLMIRDRLCEFFPGLLLSSPFNDSCFQILGRTLWMEYLCIETPMLAKNDINTGKMVACMHSFYYSDSKCSSSRRKWKHVSQLFCCEKSQNNCSYSEEPLPLKRLQARKARIALSYIKRAQFEYCCFFVLSDFFFKYQNIKPK